MIDVVIADDHNLVRQGIRALLERVGDIRVVGEAADGHEAIQLAQRLAPDVLVMDIAMPRLNGLQAIKNLHALDAGTEVVVLSMYSDEAMVRQALRSGARGYLLKSGVAEELALAVRAASRGDLYLSPAISRAIVDDLLRLEEGRETLSPYEQLTSRERQVLQLICEGHTNSTIAQELHVSVKTVEKHRRNLMSKLNVHDLAGLIRKAIKLGLVFPNE